VATPSVRWVLVAVLGAVVGAVAQTVGWAVAFGHLAALMLGASTVVVVGER